MSGVLWMMSFDPPPAFNFLVHALRALGTSVATIDPPLPLAAFLIVKVPVVPVDLRLGDLEGRLAFDELAGSSSSSLRKSFPPSLMSLLQIKQLSCCTKWSAMFDVVHFELTQDGPDVLPVV